MKKACLLGMLLVLMQTGSWSQEPETTPSLPDKALKLAPMGLTLGSMSLNGEYNRGRNSATFRVSIPASSHHDITVFDNSTDFGMRAFSLMAGYRRYLSKNHMRGFYLEPFIHYVQHRSEGTGTGELGGRKVVMDYANRLSAVGIGAQFGIQFLIRNRVVLDLFLLGPVMNHGSDKFFARETGNNIPWTHAEAEDATRRINDFIDNFPFLRNNTDVHIDAATRTADARFKGLLPGIRTGISLGIAF